MAASIHPRTYARRITRETDQPTHNIRRVSSPLEDLPTPTEDVSVEEMSRRMKKRSRQITSNAQDLPVSAGQSVEESISKHEPLSKKAKHLFEHNVDSLFDTPASAQVIPTTPSHGGKETLLPLATQRVNDSLFETPFPSEHSIFKSYVVPLADDPISPVPIGRRMLSRTTSRNFKENAAQARKFRKSLASPFNSRPASRSPSPVKTSRPSVKRTLHNKSRTLSSSSLKQHKKTSIGYNSAVTTEDSLFATSHTTNATTYQASVEGTVHALSHGRTASIPNVSSASSLLDNISAEDWLIPPKALTNNAHAQEDLHLDVFQADYPSFYFDQPNQVSTPSRRARQPMNALKNARPLDVSRTGPRSYYSDDSDAELVTAGPQASPRQTRRRRRTVVHMSSDSIFSSALDFSASSSEGPHAPGLPASQIALQSSLASPDVLSGSQNAVSVLDPAFSPASDYVSQYEDSAAKPTVPLLQSEAMLLAIPPTPGNKRSAGRLSPACDNPTESDDELYGLKILPPPRTVQMTPVSDYRASPPAQDSGEPRRWRTVESVETQFVLQISLAPRNQPRRFLRCNSVRGAVTSISSLRTLVERVLERSLWRSLPLVLGMWLNLVPRGPRYLDVREDYRLSKCGLSLRCLHKPATKKTTRC
ncbi:hypothetical protein BC835DRAFT_564359 [Cytidiella melzeri]|nr:hypothetical protein BC835DRAFT_564359 [Cytidiella melzeri]